ncbi:Solute carrier organic anion transporter family member 2B1 [Merluccius polli]|uniref:Solute carrier organic anion transporter family member n=1 Tax=Merluccius polli TaxID=89951 RepID=A0AA47M8C1_MERPO|nr:Solute carrier organic anion transporter family member 2B1 [Merluccius polli]
MTTDRNPSSKPGYWNPSKSIKGLLQLAQLMVSGCLKSSISTIEKRYGFTSQKVGLLVAFNEVGNVILIVFVSFLGSRIHRPRFIGAGAMLASVSALIIASPHFLGGTYQKAAHAGNATNHTTTGLCQSQSSISTALSSQRCGLNESPAQQGVFLVLLLGQLLLGISTVPIQPFGMSYVDDFSSRRNSPLYIGILLAVTSLGPAVGFMMGSFSLRYYVDFNKIPTDQIQLDSKDLRWVGAWWLGFLIASCILFLTSLPYLFFPRSMPKEESKSEDEKRPESVQTVTLIQFLRSFPQTARRTLQNPVFLLLCLGAGAIVGVLTFLAKFMERQFDLTTSFATMLIGVVHIPICVVAIVVGGAVMRRLDLSRKGATMWCVVAISLTLLSSLLLIFIGCPTQRVADVFPPSSSSGGGSSSSSIRCVCSPDAFNPVCASDGTEFRSPCHAGCIAMEMDDNNKVQNYTSCGCVGAGGGGGGGGGYALPGTCGSRCSHLLGLFLVLSAATCFIGATCKAPCFSMILRTVPPEDKSFALGICYMLFRVLAFLPSPVIYGSVIDKSCLLWGSKCDKKTSCQYYDLDYFRRGQSCCDNICTLLVLFCRFFGLLTLFLCLALFCFLTIMLVLKKQTGSLDEKTGSERGYKVARGTEEGAKALRQSDGEKGEEWS